MYDRYGAIVRGDSLRKEIALVFTGDEFADGGEVIKTTLKKNHVRAGFFLTGNFYANPRFKSLIVELRNDGHYLGAHSDNHLLYADWSKRDSTLVTRQQFTYDLEMNYGRMNGFGIRKEEAGYFLPPFEWYNADITSWTRQLGLQLINYSPGTLSTADYTYPAMGDRYRSSDKIYDSIMNLEGRDGLNGFILLIHIGTDPSREDKLYFRLDDLLHELMNKGYKFVRIDKLLH